MRILILGASGMLGHTLFFELARRPELETWGTVRSLAPLARHFRPSLLERLVPGVDALRLDTVVSAFGRVRPDVVINAVGVIRQLPEGREPLPCIELNARFPHRLLSLCRAAGARLVHISTDCVFDGATGGYTEDDPPTAKDVYGLSKYLGEVREPALTLRTSIVGHELRNKRSLVEWFLVQTGEVRGFARTMYSGLPTGEIARLLAEFVLPRPDLAGLYQVASEPISKYELLCLVAARYGVPVALVPDQSVAENKTLSADRFRAATGYCAPIWPDLVEAMHHQHETFVAEAPIA
jgi:dTDP-4-dehydrorhamnose reductase